MFDYTLSKEYDIDAFVKYVKLFDRNLEMEKEPLLRDVDSSLIQIYKNEKEKVVLKADAVVDATYVTSNIDLSNIILKA